MRPLFTLALLALALNLGCAKPEPTPEEAAARFLATVRAGQARQVWGMLTASSQADLTARYQALQAAQGAQEKPGEAPSPVDVLRSFGLNALGSARNPVVASPLGDHVVVRLTGARGSTDLHLLREQGGWKVDLMRSLTPVATATVTPPAPQE
ncbi:MAG: hypothetical protein KC933_22280 [Myxococcales bacterium]|nr:hypothetical protein [Myxococcales bacterium]MCB9648840.1 hypothetical protein [Deltaproteobacteria bacterium]